MNINGYELEKPLKTAGFCNWGCAEKNGKKYFLKEFLAPVYPLSETMFTKEQLELKRKACAEYERRMSRIYKMINNCSDGNVVRIEHFFRCKSKYYITTEWLEGETWQAASLLPEDQRMKLCRILLHGVGALHQAGIVHGDIKIENVVFKWLPSGYLTAKIIDFDTSFPETDPPGDVNAINGDMVYWAPETFQIMGREIGCITRAADVFALGLVFHQILAGALPDFDKEKYEYPFQVLLDKGNIYFSEKINANVKVMLAKMLDPDPDRRITLKDAGLFFGNIKWREFGKTAGAKTTPGTGDKSKPGSKDTVNTTAAKVTGFHVPGDL